MYIKLTNAERLKDLRRERGLTLKELAEQTGLSASALGSYESEEEKEINPFSVTTLAKFYGVSTDYLLGLTEMKSHPNTELRELGLSDDMIELLKSGKLNNRLLCELATHEGFRRFLVDTEIYVDRIADMRINDMNALLDATRRTILEKYNADGDDLYVRTLELAQASSALPSIYYLASNAYLYDSGTWQAEPTHTGFATWQAGCKTLSAKLRALSG